MQNRSSRLSKIFDLAQVNEKKSCEKMGAAQQSLDAEIDRLHELESYRRSYAEKFTSQKSTSAALWQDYHSFLERIDRAVTAQKTQILSGQESRDAHRRRWFAERQKLESLGRVVDRYRKAESVDADRQAQKSLDELTATGRFVRSQHDK